MTSPECSAGSSIEGSQHDKSFKRFFREVLIPNPEFCAYAVGTVVAIVCAGISIAAITEWQPLMGSIQSEPAKLMVKGGSIALSLAADGGLLACVLDYKKTTSC
jgi:hypothetical protein